MPRRSAKPHHADHGDEQDFRGIEPGLSMFQAYHSQRLMLVDVHAIERSIVSGEAGQALYDLMSQCHAQKIIDGKEIALYQRAMCGWVLKAGAGTPQTQAASTLVVSVAPPTDATLRRALRVLAMVAELHKVGYQRLRIAAGMSPSGCHWRCHITPAENIRPNGWEPFNWDEGVASYTSGAGDRYFGWQDAPGKNARQLAQMFIDRFPDILSKGAGRDWGYAGWFVGMLGAAENGRLPMFFADWDVQLEESEVPPPPSGEAFTDTARARKGGCGDGHAR